ncbi:hypothetical protein Bbelb_185170, partial [Branchiostoma belcheri]
MNVVATDQGNLGRFYPQTILDPTTTTWSGECADPGFPKNGYKNGDNFTVGSVVTFGCNDGFTLRGRRNFTCLNAGVRGWDTNDLPVSLCGVHITGRRFGVVYSPFYPDAYGGSMNCTWTIEVDSGRVKLTPEMFSVHKGDSLAVYDGNGSVLGKYTGEIKDIPEVIHSTSTKIRLVFTTENNIKFELVGWGFKIYYEAECGAHITRKADVNIRRFQSFYAPDHSGYISSPNYPGPYGNNMECTWTIEVDLGNGVKLTTVEFSLEEGHDKLLLHKGYPITNTTLMGEYTAFLLLRPPCYDPGVPENGFRDGDNFDVGSFVTFGCNDGFTLKGQEKLNCMSGYYSGWNGPLPTCKAECGGYKTASTSSPGVIYSPNYPDPYGNDMNCTWTIANRQEGMGIKMIIAEFSLEERRDKLSIYAGDHVSHNALMGEYSEFSQVYCGWVDVSVHESMTSTVELDFHSNHVFTYEGFWIRFYTKDKPENEEAGSFHSKNYPHSYRNNLYQEWSISTDVGKHIRLMFTYFDVQVTKECDSDYLIIEDPLSLDEMHHCGTCIPTPYISVGHTLHVFFVTDFAIYRTGFSAKYESVQDRSGSVDPSASDVLPSDWLTIGDKIKQISVSTSTNQVWALDIDGKPLRRTGISQSTPQGTGWEVVGTEQFLYISVGRVGVWAVSDDSTVMYRKGTFRGAGTAGTSWQAVHIDSKITSSLFNFKTFPVETDWRGHNIDQIHSGKDFVWIVASYPHFTYGYTIVRKGITSDNPEGTSWDSVQTANMKEVSVSSRTGQLWAVEIGGRVWRSPFYCEISVSVGRSGVWAVDFEGEVYHRAGTFLNETAPGVAWLHVPGVHLQQIGVGDRTVWGVDSSQRAFVKVLPTSVDGKVCQVGLKGHSMCYAIQEEDEVICPYSDKCIKECRVCDGIVDCGDDDDTDERNCWFANCPEKHRRVCDGEVGCYSPTRVCDGERNCGEITEDERDCP